MIDLKKRDESATLIGQLTELHRSRLAWMTARKIHEFLAERGGLTAQEDGMIEWPEVPDRLFRLEIEDLKAVLNR